MASFITTYSKLKFDPTEPRQEDIKLEDIAHALSFMTRANGHFPEFYSVAQHSITCYEEAIARGYSVKVAFACLLHDASEAYLADITRPVKKELPNYLVIEEKLQNAIYGKFLDGLLSKEEKRQVSYIDDTLLYYEFEHYMGEKFQDTPPELISKPAFQTLAFEQVEEHFLQLAMSQMQIDNRDCLDNKTTDNNHNGLFIGIDGCKGQWITVAIEKEQFFIHKFKSIHEVCYKYKNADAILIDMPIGLPESSTQADERPDAKLRKVLVKKASSVFSVPCRQAIYGKDKDEIREKNIKYLGKSLSAQSIAIIPKIREIEEFLLSNKPWMNRLKESHPEVCFAILNNGIPILERKVEKEGMEKRIHVLEKYYSKTREVVDKFFELGYGEGSLNDLLDALCLAVVGRIGSENGFCTIPESPKMDSKGLYMQVVIPNINL